MKSATICIISLALLLVVAGCSSEIVQSKGPRAATEPASVKVYQKAPQKYEMLGLIVVPITSDLNWDATGNATAAFDRMRAKAAALGANGLLLKVNEGDYDYILTAGDNGTFYQLCMRHSPKAVVAEAVYMIEPPAEVFPLWRDLF